MPRPKTILQADFPYSVGARCINKDWFKAPMDEVWEIMSYHLYFMKKAYDVKIHSFVLMSNHFHLLITTPQANLSEAMWYFMKETSRNLTKATDRINQTYGSRHHRCMIGKEQYYLHAYKYIYRNPIAAGLAEKAESYKYSTLHGILGKSHLLIPVEEDKLLFSKVENTLNWINQKPTDSNWSTVGRALRKPKFELAKEEKTKKQCHLESDAL